MDLVISSTNCIGAMDELSDTLLGQHDAHFVPSTTENLIQEAYFWLKFLVLSLAHG